MLDLSFPWPIGLIPIAMTAWASYGLYRAVVTRDGVTWASVVSVLGLVAFMAALTAQIVKPVIHQTLALLNFSERVRASCSASYCGPFKKRNRTCLSGVPAWKCFAAWASA